MARRVLRSSALRHCKRAGSEKQHRYDSLVHSASSIAMNPDNGASSTSFQLKERWPGTCREKITAEGGNTDTRAELRRYDLHGGGGGGCIE
jgi:hypothetical protein